jgi:hypothetical protein
MEVTTTMRTFLKSLSLAALFAVSSVACAVDDGSPEEVEQELEDAEALGEAAWLDWQSKAPTAGPTVKSGLEANAKTPTTPTSVEGGLDTSVKIEDRSVDDIDEHVNEIELD